MVFMKSAKTHFSTHSIDMKIVGCYIYNCVGLCLPNIFVGNTNVYVIFLSISIFLGMNVFKHSVFVNSRVYNPVYGKLHYIT